MFENHFGFIRRPFTTGPDVELFVSNESAQAAFDSIEYCLRGGQGIAVLTAPTGTGKTMLCQVLLNELRDEFRFSFLPSPGTSSRLGLIQAIYFGLGKRVKRRHAGITDAEMRLELIDAVRSLQVRSTGVVLLIDEAHLLSTEQLEEVRVLSSFADRGLPLIRPLLCGNPALDERLLEPELKALGQRIRCQAYLESLTRDESELFIHQQLVHAGVRNRDVFEPDAIAKIVKVSDGNTRCLNQLCDQSLYLASRSNERSVTIATVNEALETLVQLPLNWNCSLVADSTPAKTTTTTQTSSAIEIGASSESVIEFGSLDDDPSEVVESNFVEPTIEDSVVESSIEIGSELQPEPANDPWNDEPTDVTIDLSVPAVNTSHVEEHIIKDTVLPEEPIAEPVACHDFSEQLDATFRQGLPEPPVPYNAQPNVDTYAIARPEATDDVVVPVDDFVGVVPRFDGPTNGDDLLPENHIKSPGDLQDEIQTVEIGEKSKSVSDQWSENAQVERPRLQVSDSVLSAEEQLLQSCIDTRRDIATMLDTLESHVSESLADRYDIVMPEGDREPVPAATEASDIDRLTRVLEQERGPQ